MSAGNMLEMTVHLDPQPGGVLPELHLKKGARSMRIYLKVAPSGVITDYIYKPAIVKATLPDGTEFFATGGCSYENRRITVTLYEYQVRQMTAVAGRYKCTLTMLNTSDNVNRSNYMDYNFLTVLPFTVVVETRAKEG